MAVVRYGFYFIGTDAERSSYTGNELWDGALWVSSDTQEVWVYVASGPSWTKVGTATGGGGAPTDAQYVTGAANASLSAELVLGSAVVMKGTLAARPAAATAGRLYYVTDAGSERWTRDTGSAWEDVGPDWDFVTGKPATFAPIIGGGAGDAVAGNDARLTDARTPTAHKTSHQDGGSDELSVAGLSGELADLQPPKAHDHTAAAADGGVLTNDEHDGFSEIAEIAAPATPAANKIRVYSKDKAGKSELFYKNDAGDERDLSLAGGSGAPSDAEYLVGAANAGLSAERVVTDTVTISWDLGTAGQAKANVIIDAIIKRATGTSMAMGDFLTWLTLAANSADITGTGLTAVMTITGVGVGRYYFHCQLIYQATATTTGMQVAVNHTGTLTQFVVEKRTATTGTSAATAAASEATAGATGNLYEAQGERTKDTTIGSVTVSVDAANADMIVEIEGFFVVSATGSLEIKLAAEAAGLVVRAMQGSFLELKKLS